MIKGKGMDRVLYFPYISVPEDQWFTRVLLYWDQVASIVPEEYAEEPRRLSPYMSELLSAGLVQPIIPESYNLFFEAIEPFLSFVDSDAEIQRRIPKGFVSQMVHRGEASPGTFMPLHEGKFGHILADELEVRGLARPVSGHRWYEVEARTANAFMTYLAVILANQQGSEMRPITDRLSHFSEFEIVRSVESSAVHDQLRMSVLEDVLPAPSGPLRAHELASFKEKHGELLGKFRRRIESEVLRIAPIEDEYLRGEQLRLAKTALREDLEEIVQRIQARKWPRIVFGSLAGVLAIAAPLGLAVAAGAPIAAAAGVPGLLKAIYSGLEEFGSAKKDFRRDPLAYAAIAKKELTTP